MTEQDLLVDPTAQPTYAEVNELGTDRRKNDGRASLGPKLRPFINVVKKTLKSIANEHVCFRHKGAIPQSLITAADEVMFRVST